MSLDAIWDEPVASTANGDVSPQKRPRQPLFLSASDSDDERPPKRATPAPPPDRPDVDALFEDLDKEEEDDDLSYKPLAPALDLAKLAKEAEARHARGRQTQSQTLVGSSKTVGDGETGKDEGKGKSGDGDKKERRVLPKMDEERLIGSDGFPALIEEVVRFQPKGKGHEHTDLNRLLQIYQFWTHKMYPKTSFKDTVSRVEKLCHSKRMQVQLSVWRDEFKGVTKGTKADEELEDIIDLVEDSSPAGTPSLPPASSEVEDDDFDIDAMIKAEEERLATLRTTTADSGPPSPLLPLSPTVLGSAPSRNDFNADEMDLDEASLWDVVDGTGESVHPPPSNPPSSALPDGDDDMWDIIDQMEPRGKSKPTTEPRMPLSRVNPIPSLDSTNSENPPRATNDDDWDEMYS